MKQQLLWICTLVLFSTMTIAACPEDPNCPFSPDNPAAFDYAGGDYSTIGDWSKVEWNRIPIERIAEVPAEKLEYGQLTMEQRFEMTVEQISNNLPLIENLGTDVKEDRAREAIMQNYQVAVLSFGSQARILNNILLAEFGERGSINLEGKPSWKLEIDDKGNVRILEPRKITEDKISQQDRFTLVEETKFLIGGGSESIVKYLSFRNGQAYVKKGDRARVGEYEITAATDPIDIYFDTTTKQMENYVAISENNVNIGTAKDGIVKIVPQPGNRLFNMVKRDYSTTPPTLVPSTADTLEITVSGGDGLNVISRADSGKTTLLKHYDGAGETKIETGRMRIRLKEGKMNVVPPKPFSGESGPIDTRNSVAFELISDSNTGSETLRTSSSNRFQAFRNGKIVAGNNVGLEVSDLIEHNMMKTRDDLKAKYSKMNFEIYTKPGQEERYGNIPESYTEITANMAQVVDEWLREKPGMEKYIRSFYFSTIQNAGGLTGTISVGERAMDSSTVFQAEYSGISRQGTTPLGTLEHEFVHVLTGKVTDVKELEAASASVNQDPQYQKEEEELLLKSSEVEGEEKTKIQAQIIHLGLKYSSEFIKEHGFQQRQDKIMVALARKVYESDEFAALARQIDQLSENAKPLGDSYGSFSSAFQESDELVRAGLIATVGRNLNDMAKKDVPGAQQTKQKFEEIVARKTGLFPYSFTRDKGDNAFVESLSTYSELSPGQARQNPQLAQLEFDRTMSVDPPPWLRKRAEERYYRIMGGKDGSYCSSNPCGPCLIYTLTCKK